MVVRRREIDMKEMVTNGITHFYYHEEFKIKSSKVWGQDKNGDE